ncbi:MAG TPA: hypothetical protein VL371_10890 [Gemmataceae bacterium]|nr:hypothetical protein [Gemmataceae bacterium]
MRSYLIAVAAIVVALAGCSSERMVPVSGTVKTAAGKPVTGVYVVFVPVEGPKSKTCALPLDADGSFRGEAVIGKYTFYLSRFSVETDDEGKPVKRADVPKQKEYERAFRQVPPAYRTHEGAGADRKVEVTSGASFALTVGG